MSSASELKELFDMVRDMNESVESYRQLTFDDFESKWGLVPEIAEELALFGKPAIEGFSDSVLMKLYNKYHSERFVKNIPENFDERSAYIKDAILKIYDDTSDYREMLKNRDDIIKQADDARKNYVNYLNSPEYTERKEKSKNDLVEKIKDETDEKKKETYRKKLEHMISAEHLDFIFSRFNNLGDTEIKNIADNFFDPHRTKYIRDRFATKVVKLGFNVTDIQHLGDMECCLLGEDYYAFNNLFLFIAMRFIAYCDPTDNKDAHFVSSLVLQLNKLVYHRFGTQEEENHILDIIREIDDKFRPLEKMFIDKNIYDPRSEYAKKKKEKENQDIINKIKTWYKDNNQVFPEEIKDIDELRSQLKIDMERVKLIDFLSTYDIDIKSDEKLESLRSKKDTLLNPSTEETETPAEDEAKTEVLDQSQPEESEIAINIGVDDLKSMIGNDIELEVVATEEND